MCATVPTEKSRNGHIAVAADGSFFGLDTRPLGGLSDPWIRGFLAILRGLPKNIRVIADKVNPQRFML